MNWIPWLNEALQFISGFIISIGGGSALIIWLSKKFGEVWAQKYLAEEKNELEKDFTTYKSKLEYEIERQKNRIFRYSDKQFELYNSLWIQLSDLKIAADELWEEASPENLEKFAKTLKETKDKTLKSKLFIEADHYNRLQKLLEEFSSYQGGKETLIKYRNRQNITADAMQSIREDYLVLRNKQKRDEYSNLLDEIGRSFKEQLA